MAPDDMGTTRQHEDGGKTFRAGKPTQPPFYTYNGAMEERANRARMNVYFPYYLFFYGE